LVARAIYIVW